MCPGLRLIKKGAEADLLLCKWRGLPVVLKRRIVKSYRNPLLDKEIRKARTIHEARLLHEAKRAGVSTPSVLMLDLPNTTIFMEHLEGTLAKCALDKMDLRSRNAFLVEVGHMIGRLHKADIVHGDLTTSNMIIGSDGRIFFIDFGLGDLDSDVEKKGTDLHLMGRALASTHYRIADACFRMVLDGYSEEVGEASKEVIRRIGEIRSRARYIDLRSRTHSSHRGGMTHTRP